MQRKNKEIKQIFFDLDGTLLDTAPQFYLALSNVIKRKLKENNSFTQMYTESFNPLIGHCEAPPAVALPQSCQLQSIV